MLISGFEISPYGGRKNSWDELLTNDALNACLMTHNYKKCYELYKNVGERILSGKLHNNKEIYEDLTFIKMCQIAWAKCQYRPNEAFKQFSEFMTNDILANYGKN